MYDQGPASHAVDCRKQQVGSRAAQKSGPGRSGEYNGLQYTVACSSGSLREADCCSRSKNYLNQRGGDGVGTDTEHTISCLLGTVMVSGSTLTFLTNGQQCTVCPCPPPPTPRTGRWSLVGAGGGIKLHIKLAVELGKLCLSPSHVVLVLKAWRNYGE